MVRQFVRNHALPTIKATLKDFSDDRAMRLAAALAFYTIFSLAPVLLVLISLASLIWDRQAVSGAIIDEISASMGKDAQAQLEVIIRNAGNSPDRGFSTTVSIAMLMFGATVVFAQLKDALNTAFKVRPRPAKGFRTVLMQVRDRVLSFCVVLVIGILLSATLAASAAIATFGTWMPETLPLSATVAWVMNLIVGAGMATVFFALIFKYFPDVRIAWRDVWIGAAVTAVLFSIGEHALGYYLATSAIRSIYGAAGSLIAILLWVYYSAIIFLLGAEFTQVYARRCGRCIQPSPSADFAAPVQRTDGRLPEFAANRHDDRRPRPPSPTLGDFFWSWAALVATHPRRSRKSVGRSHQPETPRQVHPP
ncbi:MAG: YihY/virulence factor BrkB family protein [Phycisphaerales bacterium]|nr:YihY/virulence factor BrkB family protein [Phycisphaerales bacterium]MCI0675940.1 YihY/virulence factor BrkB family protein [Phycisphaerales bacterium]